MRRHYKFILSLIVLTGVLGLVSTPLAFAQTSIVSNGSFEQAGTAATLAQGWTGGSGSNTTEVFERRTGGPFTARTGDAYYYLASTGALFSFVFQQVTPNPGEVYTFNGFWNVNETGSAHATAKLEFKDANNNVILPTAEATQTDTAGAYTSFSVVATAPANAVLLSFVIVVEDGGGGDTIEIAIDDVEAFRGTSLQLVANKRQAKRQEAVVFTANFTNPTAEALTGATFTINVPPGFNVVRDSVILNGGTTVSAGEPGPTVTVTAGTLAASSTHQLVFQAVASSGAYLGKNYQFTVTASGSLDGTTVSRQGFATIFLVADPLFDLGTVLGKVFDDINENEVQDLGEKGVPFVRLVTEQGVMVMTDKDGQYHIPGVTPGRHLIKIDHHTLPEGTKFVTEQAYLTNVTEGILAKVSFAVKLPDESKVLPPFDKQLDVRVIDEYSDPKPELFIRMYPPVLSVMANGEFKIRPSFKIKTNYGDILAGWRIEIRDERNEEVWIGHGHGSPPSEIGWQGLTDLSDRVEVGQLYTYRLFMLDTENREDATATQYFKVIRVSEEKDLNITDLPQAELDEKREIILTDRSLVKVYGMTEPGSKVMVNEQEVSVYPDGKFEKEMMLPYGRSQVTISATDALGRTTTHVKDVNVKESTFLLAALGEGAIGWNYQKGNEQTYGGQEELTGHFFQQGRLAYFLKAKLFGRYRLTSSWDTGRSEENKLYTNFDPDDLYPTYGDESEVDFSHVDTQEKFYILAEMDRSYLKWGTFNTDFHDTKLATYNRTLSGLKVHLASPTSVANGEPLRAVTFYNAFPRQSADHNEIRGTGGSVYYLRNRRVIEGSEKLRIELRDKITGVALKTENLYEGVDYQVDYDEGRVILNKPLSSVGTSDTIIALDPLEGNPVYLIVDYEYETPFDLESDQYEDDTQGIRGHTYIGQHIKVGGTYVRELREAEDHRISGADVTIHFGKTKFYAEIANSYREQVNNAISIDGGLSYFDIVSETGSEDGQEAYLIEGETEIGKLKVSGYYQRVAPGFTAASEISQAGLEKYNFTAIYPLTDHIDLKYKRDSRETLRGFPKEFGFGEERTLTDTLQAEYLKGKWGLTAEYRHRVQKFNGGSLNAENFTTFYDSSISTAFPTNIPTLESLNPYNHAVAGKVAYQWTEKYKPYIIAQTTLGAEKPGKLLRVGLEARINDLTRITLETSVGNIGDGSIVGIERDVSEDTSMYVQWKTIDTLDFGKVENTTVGSTTRLRSGGRVFTERQMDSYRLGSQVSELIGYEKPINERITYGANYERSRVDSFNEVFDRNVVGGEITFKDFGRLKRSGHRLEVRMDNDPADAQQWLTQHAAEFRLSEDYTLAGRLNWSRTNETSLDTLFANFTELNVGIAYRPVKHDWLNGLMRYTHLDSESTPGQYGTGVQTREKSHIFAIEGAFDVNKYFQIVQKYAYKSGISRAEGSGDIRLRDFLWINRVNFHVTRKWDIGAEYRILAETGDVKNMRQGMLVEVSRDIQELVRIGAGYNFTDFNDDLRKSDNYQSQGFFLRLTGKY